MKKILIFGFFIFFLCSCGKNSATVTLEDSIISESKSQIENKEKEDVLSEKDIGVKEIILEKNYSYYTDMWEAEQNSEMVAGGAVAVMAIKFLNRDAEISIDDVSSLKSNQSSYWNLSDVKAVLDNKNIKYEEVIYLSYDDIIISLQKGYPVIAPIDTTYLEYNEDVGKKIGRYYYWGGGHYVLITGLTIRDNEGYFTVQDPYSMGHLSPDGSLIGENRLYKITDLDLAIKKWWSIILKIKE